LKHPAGLVARGRGDGLDGSEPKERPQGIMAATGPSPRPFAFLHDPARGAPPRQEPARPEAAHLAPPRSLRRRPEANVSRYSSRAPDFPPCPRRDPLPTRPSRARVVRSPGQARPSRKGLDAGSVGGALNWRDNHAARSSAATWFAATTGTAAGLAGFTGPKNGASNWADSSAGITLSIP
jgi:hypothetical protein